MTSPFTQETNNKPENNQHLIVLLKSVLQENDRGVELSCEHTSKINIGDEKIITLFLK